MTNPEVKQNGKEMKPDTETKKDSSNLQNEVLKVGEQKELTAKQKKEIEQLKKEIKKASSVTQQVDLYAKIVDDYGIDFLVSTFIPELGDAGASVVSGIFMLIQAKRIGVWPIDYVKLIGAQVLDLVVGLIPVAWDAADYFIKANKRSAKIFAKHLKKLEEKAIEKWMSTEEIAQIKADWAKFMAKMNEIYDKTGWRIAQAKNIANTVKGKTQSSA